MVSRKSIKTSRKNEPVGKTSRDQVRNRIEAKELEEKKVKTGRESFGINGSNQIKPPIVPRAFQSSKITPSVAIDKVTEEHNLSEPENL